MYNVSFYTYEEVRLRFVGEVEVCRENGSMLSTCLLNLDISTDVWYRTKTRKMPLPSVVLHRLGLQKVSEGNRIVGYVCVGEIAWEKLWV